MPFRTGPGWPVARNGSHSPWLPMILVGTSPNLWWVTKTHSKTTLQDSALKAENFGAIELQLGLIFWTGSRIEK